ncbi:hypothetical protein [Klebsiella michiganensis]|uniref:hypothetical protein n=1 Tax=Klebsiella michiganensis TaxID=1134687 RepID=UPI000D642677|nr:hypothetical protein [Klebsiella michiganensis]
MDFINSMESMLGMGDKPVQIAADDPGLIAGLDTTDIADIDAQDPGIDNSAAKHGLSDWAYKALGPVMQQIMAMATKPQQRAPLGGSGHGVSANTASNGEAVSEITKMAGGDPLQGLSGFKNLL